MALDMAETLAQMDSLSQRLAESRDDRETRLRQAMTAMVSADAAEVKRKADSGQGRPYLYASPADSFAETLAPHAIPGNFCVASVDGSHIDVDRHTPARCYLINIGGCVLTYGAQPDAQLFSVPRLYTEDADLYLAGSSTTTVESQPVEGQLVGLKRAVEEVSGLVDAVRDVPGDLPALGLVDGTLLLWGLAGRGYPSFVREKLLGEGLVPAFDKLQEMAASRSLAVAAYTSLPQSREVVNTLRLFLCPYDVVECSQSCSGQRSSRSPCDLLRGLLDRHLFQELLAPGERSSVYRSNSSISREFYGPHQVYFYYMNTGDEIARVEVPEWVAKNDRTLELSHALILDQCVRGRGYPAAISEAHEQAVVTGQDREIFKHMLEDALQRNHLPVFTSEKARSKRMRWL